MSSDFCVMLYIVGFHEVRCKVHLVFRELIYVLGDKDDDEAI